MEHDTDLQRLGRYVAAARRAHFGTVQAAVQAAGVNTLTWNKAEKGERIRGDRMTAIEKALGWNIGDAEIIAQGGEPFSSGTSSNLLESVSDDDLLNEVRRRMSTGPVGGIQSSAHAG